MRICRAIALVSYFRVSLGARLVQNHMDEPKNEVISVETKLNVSSKRLSTLNFEEKGE